MAEVNKLAPSIEERLGSLSPEKRAVLERFLEERRRSEERIPRRPEGNAVLPLSFAQQRMWFMDNLAPGNPFYSMDSVTPLQFAVDAEVLQRTLNEIIRRHESLRTTFVLMDGEPRQVIAPELQIEMPVLDLRSLSQNEAQQTAAAAASEQAQKPFHLPEGPLVRAMLLQLAEDNFQLLFTIHHIVSDGWSMEVFFRELSQIYEAFSNGLLSPLPDLRIQYGDFALWQREWLSGERLQRQLAFWKQTLQGAAVLSLPTDHRRPAVQSYRGAAYSFQLPQALYRGLKMFSQRQGVTLYMTLLAAFQILLHRYTGQDDIVVGSPTAGRNRPELEPLIGFFVNTLVMRGDLSGNPSFRQMVHRIRDMASSAYTNQDLPFERLVEELQPQRELSRNPLFQVSFQCYLSPPAKDVSELETLDPPPHAGRGSSIFDMAVNLYEAAGRLYGVIEYSTDLFDGTTIERTAGHFRTLLESALANPELPIGDLNLLTSGERRQILEQWAGEVDTHRILPPVHRLFEQHAQECPDSVAVVGDRALTYGDLDSEANRLASLLASYGAGPETLAGICMPRGWYSVLSQIAVLKCGAAFLPLDPGHPQERISWMIRDSRAAAVLTLGNLCSTLTVDDVPVICVDEPWQSVPDGAANIPDICPSPDDLAYVIYTSGSTGRPKAVEVTHRGLSNLVDWHHNAYQVCAQDKATMLAGTAFDASIWELWPYLTAGACVQIVSDEIRDDPGSLLSWMAQNGTTISFIPTPIAERILEEPMPRGLAIRALLTGGDRLHHPPPSGLPFRVFNNYGPTENTVVTTWTSIDPNSKGTPPIGRPISNCVVYVMDRYGKLVPEGIPGELWAGGHSLARGYRGRPGLTEDRFLPDPFRPGMKVYRTGDLVRYRSNGELEFLGRIDRQVKIRGFRIEPAEIETTLKRHPAIQEAVVIAPDEQRLVAYVQAAEPHPAPQALRSFVAEHLPEYMVPAVFQFVPTFALTRNGKIDRKALPDIDCNQAVSTKSFVAPRTGTEATLASMWTSLLGIEQAGIEDNFFELGGHSLLATRLVSQIQRLLDVSLPLMRVFESPTIAAQAELVDTARGIQNRKARAAKSSTSSPQPLSRIDPSRLSDREVDDLLSNMLAKGWDDDSVRR